MSAGYVWTLRLFSDCSHAASLWEILPRLRALRPELPLPLPLPIDTPSVWSLPSGEPSVNNMAAEPGSPTFLQETRGALASPTLWKHRLSPALWPLPPGPIINLVSRRQNVRGLPRTQGSGHFLVSVFPVALRQSRCCQPMIPSE